jgi:hypothetical protein
MTSSPVAVIDQLNELLEAEVNSIFRFMGEGYPYLNRASAEVRTPLQQMVETIDRRAGALVGMIERLGGTPRIARGIDREEQYLAFLSLKFLIPKLVDSKKLLIQRYENALRAIRSNDDGAADAKQLIDSLLAEHRAQLQVLEQAAERVAKTK